MRRCSNTYPSARTTASSPLPSCCARRVDASTICNHTQIDMLFLDRMKAIVDYERVLAAHPGDRDYLREARRMGFADKYIAKRYWNTDELRLWPAPGR